MNQAIQVTCILLGLAAAPSLHSQGVVSLSAPTSRFLGQVQDAKGPVAGASVYAVYRRYGFTKGNGEFTNLLERVEVKTDAEGRYVLSIPPWYRASIYATAGDRISVVADHVTPAEPASIGRFRTLTLGEAKTLTGQLLHRRRSPREKIRLHFYRVPNQETGALLHFETEANEDGSFKLAGLPAGSYEVKLESRRWRFRRPVVIEPGEAHKLSLSKAITLSGRLTTGTALGKPIAGARIELIDPTQIYVTRTAIDGTFKLAGIEEGPGQAILVRPDSDGPALETRLFALEPGLSPRDDEPQIKIQLGQGRRCSGTVLNAFGQPAPGVEVLFECRYHPQGIEPTDVSIVVMTDKAGRYLARTLDHRALYEVFAVLPNGERQEMGQIVPVNRASEMGQVAAYTIGSRRMVTQLNLPTGISQESVELRLYGPKSRGGQIEFRHMVPLGSGRYLSPSLPAGEFVLFAVHKELGFGRVKATITPATKQQSTSALAITPSREVVGIVMDAAKKPMPGIKVALVTKTGSAEGTFKDWTDFIANVLYSELWPKGSFTLTTKTDAQGKFSLLCRETSGEYDIVIGINDNNTEQAARIRPVRITNALGQKPPIRVVIQ